MAKYETNAIYHDDLLVGLFRAQASAALEGLCGGDEKELEQGIEILRDANGATRAIRHVNEPAKAPTNPADIYLLKLRQQCVAENNDMHSNLSNNSDHTTDEKAE